MGKTLMVKMKGITKRFPGVTANQNVHLELLEGEIHALLGENGSGKSTLMSVLSGLYRPDEGEIYIRGERVNFLSPRDAINAGIGMVHQHFRLVGPFTVAENIALGSSQTPFKLKLKGLEEKIRQLSTEFGLSVNPAAPVWRLSLGELQRVEIIKMLYRNTNVLILDEPTAVLTPGEVKSRQDGWLKPRVRLYGHHRGLAFAFESAGLACSRLYIRRSAGWRLFRTGHWCPCYHSLHATGLDVVFCTRGRAVLPLPPGMAE